MTLDVNCRAKPLPSASSVPGLAKIVGLADESDPARMCHVREWAVAMIEQAGHSREVAQMLLHRILQDNASAWPSELK